MTHRGPHRVEKRAATYIVRDEVQFSLILITRSIKAVQWGKPFNRPFISRKHYSKIYLASKAKVA